MPDNDMNDLIRARRHRNRIGPRRADAEDAAAKAQAELDAEQGAAGSATGEGDDEEDDDTERNWGSADGGARGTIPTPEGDISDWMRNRLTEGRAPASHST